MKTNTQIDKEQAIAIMSHILRKGCAIPMASIGIGGCGYRNVGPILMDKDISWYVSKLKDKNFRIVPTSEISEEFSDCDLNYYDVCVEFTNKDGNYSEQYLLWDLDYCKDYQF